MDNNYIENNKEPIEKSSVKLIGSYIVSAMDMEDKILESSYADYMGRQNWPNNLSEQAFNEIIKYLTLLIDETKMHQKMFQNLKDRLAAKK
jgi:hypothetical protein